MQKVITINLNGNAYQLEERGYDALHEYLVSADRALTGNPDRAEIMADLEQAIADKCQRFLGPHKSVITAAEIDEVVAEMGPIETETTTENTSGANAAGTNEAPHTPPPPRRLYRIPAGAMIAGVCNGLAAYFGVDVAFIRIAFVILVVVTKGVGLLFYIVMMFVIPEANTPEERAVAGGVALNAKAVVERAKKQYAEGTKAWRRQWRQQQRHWRRRYGWTPGAPVAYAPPPTALIAFAPVFAFVHLALFLAMMAMVISLVNTGAILTWQLPDDVPLWAGVLTLLIGYQIVVSPIRAAHHWSWHRQHAPWFTFWSAVVWMIGLAITVWIASHHLAEIREFLQRLPEIVREFAFTMRDLFER